MTLSLFYLLFYLSEIEYIVEELIAFKHSYFSLMVAKNKPGHTQSFMFGDRLVKQEEPAPTTDSTWLVLQRHPNTLGHLSQLRAFSVPPSATWPCPSIHLIDRLWTNPCINDSDTLGIQTSWAQSISLKLFSIATTLSNTETADRAVPQ